MASPDRKVIIGEAARPFQEAIEGLIFDPQVPENPPRQRWRWGKKDSKTIPEWRPQTDLERRWRQLIVPGFCQDSEDGLFEAFNVPISASGTDRFDLSYPLFKIVVGENPRRYQIILRVARHSLTPPISSRYLHLGTDFSDRERGFGADFLMTYGEISRVLPDGSGLTERYVPNFTEQQRFLTLRELFQS